MRNLIIAAIVLCLAGCAAQPQKISTTSSGNPEVIVNTTSTDEVKGKITEALLSKGAAIEKETNSSISFSKQLEGFEEIMMRTALGNSSSTPVKQETTFTFVKVDGGVKIYAASSAFTQNALGQISRTPLNGSKFYNQVQTFLYSIRDKVEKH